MRPQPLAMPTARPTGSLCRSLISREAIVLIASPFNLRLSPLRSLDRTVGAMQRAGDRPRRVGANGGECVGRLSFGLWLTDIRVRLAVGAVDQIWLQCCTADYRAVSHARVENALIVHGSGRHEGKTN
jgi:hypothetical protein